MWTEERRSASWRDTACLAATHTHTHRKQLSKEAGVSASVRTGYALRSVPHHGNCLCGNNATCRSGRPDGRVYKVKTTSLRRSHTAKHLQSGAESIHAFAHFVKLQSQKRLQRACNLFWLKKNASKICCGCWWLWAVRITCSSLYYSKSDEASDWRLLVNVFTNHSFYK